MPCKACPGGCGAHAVGARVPSDQQDKRSVVPIELDALDPWLFGSPPVATAQQFRNRKRGSSASQFAGSELPIRPLGWPRNLGPRSEAC